MKQHFLLVLVTCLLSLTACTSDDWTGAGGNGENAIRFSAYTTALKPGSGAHTRNAETTPASLKASGFGIMAYQSVGDYDPSAASTEFYMEDQHVTWNSSAWTYSPTKYWPAGSSYKLSFFAYGPYGATGVSLVKDSKEPKLTVTLPADPKETVDVVTADMRNLGSGQSSSPVTFTFRHVMAAVKMKAKASADLTGNQQVQLHVTGLKLKHSEKLASDGTYSIYEGHWFKTRYLPDTYDLGDAANGILNRDLAIDAVDVSSDAAGVDLFGTNTLYLIPINGATGSAEGEVQAEVSFKLRTRPDNNSAEWVESSKTLTVNLPAGGFKQGSLTSYTFTIGLDEIKVSAEITETKLITGNYTGALGDVSRILIDNTWTYDVKKTSTNQYSIDGLTALPASGTVSVYIKDNQENKEVFLLTTSNASFDQTNGILTLNLSPGGMEGQGTEKDPYQVTTAAQLRGVSVGQINTDAVNNGQNDYIQMNDIDLSFYSNWKPIKSGRVYDGGSYNILNLTSTQGGIFSYSGGTIKNVHLKSGKITTKAVFCVGGIVNNCTQNKVINCSNNATIKAEKGSLEEVFTGGIAGGASEKGMNIEYCKNSGNITGELSTGGIVGFTWTGDRIAFCYNTGTITDTSGKGTAKNMGCGGIFGVQIRTKIEYCYNIGTIIVKADDANKGNIGGVTGWNYDSVSHSWGISAYPIVGRAGISDVDNNIFNPSSAWPTYSEDLTNGWGSAHWKPYAMGEYPKLLWEK